MTSARGRWLRMVVQLVGFAAGLSLLGWVVMRAGEELDGSKIERLRGASWWQVALLVAISAGSVGLNGVAWWWAIRPARRLGMGGVQATNAAATALALLPFKLSIVFRVASHRRRDGVPVLVIGGWLGALSAVMLCALGPAVVATLALGEVGGLWWLVALGGAACCAGAVVASARWARSDGAWALLERLARRVLGERGERVVRSEHAGRLREGAVMLADVRAVGVGVALRFADALGFAARFWLASRIAGEPIDAASSVIAGTGFFVLGAVAPTGSVGVREGGTAGLFAAMGVEEMAAAILVVSAVDAGVVLVLGLAGGSFVWPGLVRGGGGIAAGEGDRAGL